MQDKTTTTEHPTRDAVAEWSTSHLVDIIRRVAPGTPGLNGVLLNSSVDRINRLSSEWSRKVEDDLLEHRSALKRIAHALGVPAHTMFDLTTAVPEEVERQLEELRRKAPADLRGEDAETMAVMQTTLEAFRDALSRVRDALSMTESDGLIDDVPAEAERIMAVYDELEAFRAARSSAAGETVASGDPSFLTPQEFAAEIISHDQARNAHLVFLIEIAKVLGVARPDEIPEEIMTMQADLKRLGPEEAAAEDKRRKRGTYRMAANVLRRHAGDLYVCGDTDGEAAHMRNAALVVEEALRTAMGWDRPGSPSARDIIPDPQATPDTVRCFCCEEYFDGEGSIRICPTCVEAGCEGGYSSCLVAR